ncbi:MAG TPA: 3-phosphoshikimate 1-carboxyvinyltransferase, partial [Nitrospiria bacterium]|nr:3-phosphoshikimate 1-carboxyvinyltransferase [Nitrospiria bacterium]
MKSVRVKALPALSGELFVPGDKSITHRAVMLGSLGEGTTVVSGFLTSEDCLRTMAAFLAMGVEIDVDRPEGRLQIAGRGIHGLAEPAHVLDLGNSGTSIRLLTGILAAQSFFSVMTGDASLRSRPMRRVVEPLRQMGGKIFGRSDGNLAPLAIVGGALAGIEYDLPVASAQVKSALLLAGLYAKGETVLREPHPSRDHTERLFRHFGIPLRSEGGSLRVRSIDGFAARDVAVPGDFSSAAFFIVAATLIPGSDVLIRGVGVNQTRTGLLDALREMGGKIDVENTREEAGEPVADLRIRAAVLKGIQVGGGMIPRLIDE